MKILLIDCGTKLPSLALMRPSTWHKAKGDQVSLMNFGDKNHNPAEFEKIYVSVIFTRDQQAVEQFRAIYGEKVIVGGPGWNLKTRLPDAIEKSSPDWDLYTAEILFPRIKGPYSKETRWAKAQLVADSGVGRFLAGCNRRCRFCRVSLMEGNLHEASQFDDIVNPRSNNVHLLDNSFGDFPKALERLAETQQRGLVLNLSQGLDVRSASPAFMETLVNSDLWGNNIYIAWDRMQDERQVLAGFDTTQSQDQYHVDTLHARKVRPYLMVYEQVDKKNRQLACFKRFVNAFFFKRMDFETEYEPWLKFKSEQQPSLF